MSGIIESDTKRKHSLTKRSPFGERRMMRYKEEKTSNTFCFCRAVAIALAFLAISSQRVECFSSIQYISRSYAGQSSSYHLRPHSSCLCVIASSSLVPEIKTHRNDSILDELGLPTGLRQLLTPSGDNNYEIQKRFWILDNSGSMALQDGHCLVSIDKSAECSRWAEVQETVNCHAELASRLGPNAPTEFRLLNSLPQASPTHLLSGWGKKKTPRPASGKIEVGKCTSRRNQQREVQRVQDLLQKHPPKGLTALPDAIDQVRQDILKLLPELQKNKARVALVIATDGSNYNRDTIGNHMSEAERQAEVQAALESLQDLPVHVVVRLCTDYQPLVEFYNELDVLLPNLCLDVLDDYNHEAQQVYKHNPWLNYALPLHRVREMGQVSPLWDLLDERSLTQPEIRDFCKIMLGPNIQAHDGRTWEEFCDQVEIWQGEEKLQFHPHYQTMKPWMDVDILRALSHQDGEEDATPSR